VTVQPPGGRPPGIPPILRENLPPQTPPAPGASTDHTLARELALEAGRRLIELRARGGEPDLLRKAGDRLSHEFLTAELAARRPGDAVLSEEGADDPARLVASRVWIVDPLDGTSEFGEPGRTDWAVHVALWERSDVGDSGDLTAGAVALPAQDTVLSTALPPSAAPGGATKQGERGSRVRIVVSRSRAPRLVYGISSLIGAELVPLGSAGAKVAAVVCGEADAYVHAGGFYEWDTAAPVAVARAAGFHASRIDGSPLAYNQADVKMPDILVCRPALAGALLQAIRKVT
jgi:3'(2'), 5'-bisphosphate nucleotidase